MPCWSAAGAAPPSRAPWPPSFLLRSARGASTTPSSPHLLTPVRAPRATNCPSPHPGRTASVPTQTTPQACHLTGLCQGRRPSNLAYTTPEAFRPTTPSPSPANGRRLDPHARGKRPERPPVGARTGGCSGRASPHPCSVCGPADWRRDDHRCGARGPITPAAAARRSRRCRMRMTVGRRWRVFPPLPPRHGHDLLGLRHSR
jgi:hypothetical protein